jgi:hypothetical protein
MFLVEDRICLHPIHLPISMGQLGIHRLLHSKGSCCIAYRRLAHTYNRREGQSQVQL